MSAGLARLNQAVLKLFLLVVFVLYYQTRGIPGTIHGWILVAGLLLTLPALLKARRPADLPLDYLFLALFALLIVIGYFINVFHASSNQLQAYLLAFACYIFVRENMSMSVLTFFYSLMKYFLLLNGALVLIQFNTGSFYPALHLAAGTPPLLLPSGFADGPTKNGMLIAFALSALYGRLLWAPIRSSAGDAVAFIVGLVSLLLSTSRAGLLSFAVVVLLGGLYAIIRRKRFAVNVRSASLLAVIILVPGVVLLLGVTNAETLLGLGGRHIERYAADVVMYKLTRTEDDSFSERFSNIDFAVQRISESPLHVLSAGFGTGSFEVLNGLNAHNSYIEVLFETGIYGWLAFMFLLVHVIRKALSRHDAVLILPMMTALLSVLVFMSVHDILRGRIVWIPLAVLAAFAYRRSARSVRVPGAAVPRLFTPSAA